MKINALSFLTALRMVLPLSTAGTNYKVLVSATITGAYLSPQSTSLNFRVRVDHEHRPGSTPPFELPYGFCEQVLQMPWAGPRPIDQYAFHFTPGPQGIEARLEWEPTSPATVLEDGPHSSQQARGRVPVHPNCRCAPCAPSPVQRCPTTPGYPSALRPGVRTRR